MAVSLFNGTVSDLCLGKPELPSVSAKATVSDALLALRASGDNQVSVWACGGGGCICVGKFSVADAVLFLCREDNLVDPIKAFEAPVSVVLPKSELPLVRHLDPDSSLLEAIDCILEGAQNLVIPKSRKKFISRQRVCCDSHSSHLYCWLTPEDVVRYLLNSIGAFSPIPTFSIDSLNVIDHDIMAVAYDKPASSALGLFASALNEQKPVAVVDEDQRLIGDISPLTLSFCDETAAAAIMALSVVDLMAYIGYGDPPEDLVQLVKVNLKERNLVRMLELMDECFHCSASSSSSSCSSDDESLSSCSGLKLNRRCYWARRSEAIICSPRSSLVAVMVQALANRIPCIWVVEDDQTLVGAVTFAGMLKVFRSAAICVV